MASSWRPFSTGISVETEYFYESSMFEGQPETVILKKTVQLSKEQEQNNAMVDTKPHRKPKMEKKKTHPPNTDGEVFCGRRVSNPQGVTVVSLLPPTKW